jgi:alpha(1,3/1,4) fucosyltransferase
MQTIKIYFTDLWPNAKKDNFFLDFLKKHFNVIIDPDPDYLFYSVYGNEHLKYTNCIKIFYTGENMFPDFNFCDYALGFHYLDLEDRYLRFPLYVTYPGFSSLKYKKLPDEKMLLNRKFCNFIYSNSSNAAPQRELFFRELSKYKKVDSGGKFLNNIGYYVPDKGSFIKDYKFTFAFENSSVKGYTTEKIMEPMLANSLPLYWGNSLVSQDFNEASFINVVDDASFEKAIEEIIRLDNDDDAYLQKMKNDWLNEAACKIDWEDRLLQFLSNIFLQPIHLAKRKCDFGFVKFDLEERRFQAELLEKRRKKNHYKVLLLKNINKLRGNKTS